MGLFITVTYTGDFSGEDPLTETDAETTGDLFRQLSGRDPSRRWDSLGRCVGKAYIDGPDGQPVQVGWVFEARDPDGEKGRREAWVSVYTAPPTVTRVNHPATF